MSKDYGRLWKNVISANDEDNAIRILAEILSDRQGRNFITNLEDREDAKWCIEILNNAIVEGKLKSVEKQVFFIALRRLAGSVGRLPESMVITDRIDVDGIILASGGFADVRCGRYLGHRVAVKTLRVTEMDNVVKFRKKFCKEFILWGTLNHPNVLKPFGVEGIEVGRFATVSEWMEHGNIVEYIKKYSVNRLDLLHDAAQGLKYLHGAGLSHGDLKGPNILMSNDTPPRACLADFGFMSMVLDPIDPMACCAQLEGGTKAFMSPELLVPSKFGFKDSGPTPHADIYAFGMVIFQILTGKFPFCGMRETEIVVFVIEELRPKKPEDASAIGFSDSLWDLVQRCWSGDMGLRPQVVDVVTCLRQAAGEWNGLMPPSALAGSVSNLSEHNLFSTPTWCLPPSINTGGPSQSQEEFDDDRQVEESYPHLNQDYEPPPSQLRTARKVLFKLFNGLFLQIFGSSKRTKYNSDRYISCDADLTAIALESQRKSDQDLIDKVDEMLENTVYDRHRHKLLHILCKMCSRGQRTPTSMHIAGCLNREDSEKYRGVNTSVFRGEYKGRPVAIKVLRLYLTSDVDKCLKAFFREAVTWRHLRHPNILPLWGVDLDLEQHKLSMISEWMVYGNINEFVKGNGGINRVQLLADATNGLEYMHSLHMVHGDLKGANILINKSCRACLADFGLSTIVGVGNRAATGLSFFHAASKTSLMSFTAGGTTRWMSPELLDPERFGKSDDRPTKQSDCYALGMVVYEVLCGKAPYWKISNEVMVMNTITNGGRPQKPEDLENLESINELWGIIEQCWSVDATTRPDVRTVLSYLNHSTCSWERRKLV